jgi:uncharacterized membrane protein
MALVMAAALFDGLGFVWPNSSPRKAQLQAAGYFTIMLGALGTFPAVLSGLLMTKGEVLGHDALLFHHLFVWPAFAGIVGLGVWRAVVNDQASNRSFIAYLIMLFLTAGLMAGAGYWGGELVLNS